MKTVKLLQIGDVHYPEFVGENLNLDSGDRGFPSGVRSQVFTHPSQTVARVVQRLVSQDKDIRSIIICGDITSRGELEGFKSGLRWLGAQLGLSNRGRWPIDSVHAVPGNHDVDRKLVAPGEHDVHRKFEGIERVWADQSDLVLTVRRLRSTSVTGAPEIALHSLNSCLGCGEFRGLPDAICNALWAATVEMIDAGRYDDYHRLQYEQVDTRAFSEREIEELIHSIMNAGTGVLPIVVSHHNLLPQGLVRNAPYTEVVNGGNMRRRLTNCRKPVIYLHGHIHDDPIEDITRLDGASSPGSLVTISAPLFRDGFNVLSIVFGRSATPIGCAVEQYRRQHPGDVIKREVTRIRLVRDASKALAYLDDAARTVLRGLDGTFIRLRDLVQKIREQGGPHRNVIIDRLREASWLGLAIIANETDEPDHWQIQGVRT